MDIVISKSFIYLNNKINIKSIPIFKFFKENVYKMCF